MQGFPFFRTRPPETRTLLGNESTHSRTFAVHMRENMLSYCALSCFLVGWLPLLSGLAAQHFVSHLNATEIDRWCESYIVKGGSNQECLEDASEVVGAEIAIGSVTIGLAVLTCLYKLAINCCERMKDRSFKHSAVPQAVERMDRLSSAGL